MQAGKTALVRGSTSGIGLGIARVLAAVGTDIVLNGFGGEDEIEKIIGGLKRQRNVGVMCSDQAASITGALLPIDGGWTAR